MTEEGTCGSGRAKSESQSKDGDYRKSRRFAQAAKGIAQVAPDVLDPQDDVHLVSALRLTLRQEFRDDAFVAAKCLFNIGNSFTPLSNRNGNRIAILIHFPEFSSNRA